jgi:UDP:flavonoid glycosyltransferase YjiC (YdhE family)
VRIALATVGTTGDVMPFVALAEGLRAAGHAVVAVSWELHRRPFEEASVTFMAAGPATTSAEISATAAKAAAAGSPMAQITVLRDFHLRGAVAHCTDLRKRLAGHDLVVLHGIHSLAEAVTRDLGVRYATAVFDPVLLPTSSAPPAGMPSLGPLNSLGWRMLDGMLRRQDGPLTEALAAAGSGSAGTVTMFRARSPLLHLVAVSPAIAPPPPDLDASTHFTGAWHRQGPPGPLSTELLRFLDEGEPPVVVTFGSMAAPDAAATTGATLAGIRLAGRRAILQDGDADSADADGVLRIGPVDHPALFPRAAAVVHHGGAGTTHAAVAASVPSVVVPHVGDQPFWAHRLHRLGVAPAPLPLAKVSAQAMADRIGSATAEGMRSVAARLGERVAADRGVDHAIELLERAIS